MTSTKRLATILALVACATIATLTTIGLAPGPSQHALRAQFVALVTPYMASLSTLDYKIDSAKTDAQLTATLAPILSASRKLDDSLREVRTTAAVVRFAHADAKWIATLKCATMRNLNTTALLTTAASLSNMALMVDLAVTQ
jgi:hypothetical protein